MRPVPGDAAVRLQGWPPEGAPRPGALAGWDVPGRCAGPRGSARGRDGEQGRWGLDGTDHPPPLSLRFLFGSKPLPRSSFPTPAQGGRPLLRPWAILEAASHGGGPGGEPGSCHLPRRGEEQAILGTSGASTSSSLKGGRSATFMLARWTERDCLPGPSPALASFPVCPRVSSCGCG